MIVRHLGKLYFALVGLADLAVLRLAMLRVQAILVGQILRLLLGWVEAGLLQVRLRG